MTDHTAVGLRVPLDVGFPAARTRLKILTLGGMLLQASEVAYCEGIADLVESAGPSAGLTRLADVGLEDLTEAGNHMHIALCWEALAADGKLFTALLADLMLIAAGNQGTVLSLTGTFWPPPGQATAGLSRAVVRRCAMAAIGRLLDLVACQLVHPAGAAGAVGIYPAP